MTIDYTRMDERGPSAQPPPGTWWSRNGKWVILVGCLTPLLLAGSCVAAIAFFVFGAIRSTDLYTDSVHRAQTHPAVVEHLGAPVEAGWWVTGNVSVDGNSGSADFTVPLRGTKNRGSLDVKGTRDGGAWAYSMIRVRVDDGPVIELSPQADPSPAESPGTAAPAP